MIVKNWLDKYETDLELKYNSYQTRKNYYSCVGSFLKRFQKFESPKEIPNDLIKEWLLEAKTINTRKHRLCALRVFYATTIRMPKKITKIPYPKKEKKLPIVLAQQEVQKMFSVCENKKHLAILAVLYSCGLRVSELINLKWDNLDRDRRVINILGAKGNKDRQVPLNESLIKILEDYWKEYKSKEYIFNGQKSLQYSERSVGEVMKQLAEKAGINKRVYTHLIRHCSFTHLLEEGIDISIIQKIAGHESVKTTQGYTHIAHNLISKVKTPLDNINLT